MVVLPDWGDTDAWACGHGTLPSMPSGRLPMLQHAPRRRPSSNAGMSSCRDMLWSPTIRAALIAGTPFCPGCGTSRASAGESLSSASFGCGEK
jgi:hypothetical protein